MEMSIEVFGREGFSNKSYINKILETVESEED